MPKVDRSVLKGYLERGDKPSQSQFATLIDSMLNIVEDGYLIGLREYDPLKQYLPGDTMIYIGSLYECLSLTSGVFDPPKWKVITSLGAVVYSGTWDAGTNSPTLADGTGSQGFYYVVTASGSQNLGSGVIDFEISDWVIYNGTIWQKVDNSQAPVDATHVSFVPGGSITATNVQDAIDQVRDNAEAEFLLKADKVIGATTDDIAILDVSGNLVDGGKKLTDYLDKTNSTSFTPTGDYNPSTKKYVDDADVLKADKVIGATTDDIAILDASGDLVDGGKKLTDYLDKTNSTSYTPTGDYNPSTKKYVDDADALKADKVVGATTDDIAILDVSGNLVDGGKKLTDYLDKTNSTSYTPTGDYNPSTKKYVDDINASKADKVVGATLNDIAILDVSGNLVDGGKKLTDYLDKGNTTAFTPTGDYNPSTKKYVDDANALKADKVVGATLNDIAILNASGNLVDGGKKLTDYLDKANTTSYTPTANFNPSTKKYVDDADTLKADKVVGATLNDIAILNASGNLVDGGKKLTDYLDKANTTSYTPTANFNPATKKYVDDSVAAVPTSPKVFVMPFTFGTIYTTTASAYTRIPLQISIPGAADVFPGTTTITVKIFVDYLTTNGTTSGKFGLLDFTDYTGGTIAPVSGSDSGLSATGGDWVTLTGPSFTVTPGKSYSIVFQRSAGTGSIQIEGGSLILVYS